MVTSYPKTRAASILIVGVCALVATGQEISYRSPVIKGGLITYVDHVKVKQGEVQLSVPSPWVKLEPLSSRPPDLLVSYQYPQEYNCFLEVHHAQLAEAPQSASAAHGHYTNHLGSLEGANFIQGARETRMSFTNGFAQTYVLGPAKQKPPLRIVTCFVQSNTLFSVALSFSDHFAGPPRRDYYEILQSIEFKPNTFPSILENAQATEPAKIENPPSITESH